MEHELVAVLSSSDPVDDDMVQLDRPSDSLIDDLDAFWDDATLAAEWADYIAQGNTEASADDGEADLAFDDVSADWPCPAPESILAEILAIDAFIFVNGTDATTDIIWTALAALPAGPDPAGVSPSETPIGGEHTIELPDGTIVLTIDYVL